MADLLKTSSNKSYQLLEISLISAYDLDPPSSGIKTYAVLWVDPKQKIKSSAVETADAPTWNDEKFVFIVDSKTINSITTARLVVELYCCSEDGNDTLLGFSRPLLGMFGNCSRHYSSNSTGTFREYHVRRPDGYPQGVLNLGITVLDDLPITDEQLVRTGLAIDCKKLPAQAAFGGKKGVAAVLRGLFRKLSHGKKKKN